MNSFPSNDNEPELHICREIAQPKSKASPFRPPHHGCLTHAKNRTGTIVDTNA
jgi:hypothetical protein